MSKQQPWGDSVKAVKGMRPIRRRTFSVIGSAALIHECSTFVAELDAHRFGAAIVLIALVTLSAIFVALAVALRAASASCDRK